MSRSGYSYDDDQWAMIRYRGAVASAIRGRRGQAMLRELADALDSMTEKVLIDGLFREDGKVCALGRLADVRGLPMPEGPDDAEDDIETYEWLSNHFGVAESLVREVMFVNDEYPLSREDDARRWRIVRDWVSRQIKEEKP